MAAGFLGTGAVDAYGLHRCPHHDGLPGGAAEAGGHGHSDAAHAGDARVDGARAAAGGESHADHGPCTCVGACGLTGAAHPVPLQSISVAAEAAADTGSEHPAADAPLFHTDYILPFANAPPSVG